MSSAVARERVGWWLTVLALSAVVGYVLSRVVGSLALGLFLYYALRPLYRRIEAHAPRGLAATVTTLGVSLPLVALVGYLAVLVAGELLAATGGGRLPVSGLLGPYLDAGVLSASHRRAMTTLLDDPVGFATSEPALVRRALRATSGFVRAAAAVVFALLIAVTVAFFLLRDEDRLHRWTREELLGAESAAYAYLRAVDRDLETVYLGNVATVALVGVLAAVVYHGYNALAPASVAVPFPTTLALATGLASFVPLVVSKIVYVPLTLSLAVAALRLDAGLLGYPVALFVVALLALDLLPLAVLRPYVAGRNLHTGATMLAYVLGTAVFGWYGLFLGPLLLVLAVQALTLVVPDLIHGEPLTPEAAAPSSIGSNPGDTETE